jgi:hypothetical protein
MIMARKRCYLSARTGHDHETGRAQEAVVSLLPDPGTQMNFEATIG